MIEHNYVYQAKVVRVVDGDTIHAEVSLGFDHYQMMILRLFGINAPEKREQAGMASKLALAVQLPPTTPILIVSVKDRQEKFGRYLATVYTLDGLNVNDWLVGSGYAALRDYR